ncbi:MAG: phosphopantetheine-binding protein, partial [Pseudomonadota bacterium]
LPAVDIAQHTKANAQRPSTETERAVAVVWERLLGASDISVHDNFFALGGHSLLASRLITALNEEYSLAIPIAELFDRQTVFELSQFIDREVKLRNAFVAPTAQADTRDKEEEVWEI